MILPFLGASYRSQSLNVAAARTVNFYPEVVEGNESKARVVLYPTPGFEKVSQTPGWPVRGLYTVNGRTFVVGGDAFCELTESGGVISCASIGTVTDDGLPVTMCSNGDAGHQVFITSGDDAYIFDTTANTLSTVTPGGDARMGAFVDGYFVALDTTTATIYVSDLENGTAWTTGSGQRNTAADRWKSMVVAFGEIWLFGSQKSDVWYNAGDTFPFAPRPGAFMQQGIAAPWSAAVLGNRVIWLGQNDQGEGVVWAAQGYTPVQISDKALAWALQQYSTLEDAVAWTYQDQGHSFYVLNFPTAGATWVYDDATNAWHERGWWNPSKGDYDAYRASCHTFAFGKHLVGDSVNSSIYDLDIAHYTDAADGILRRMRQGPHLCDEQSWHVYRSVQLDLETGIGNTVTANPTVLLQWSDDGGHTWSHEHEAEAGAQGYYRARAIWRRLGRSRDRIFRVIVSDPVPWRLINFYGSIEKGTS